MCLLSLAMMVWGLWESPEARPGRDLTGRWEGGLYPPCMATAEAVERESAYGLRILGMDLSGLQASL